MNFNAIKRGKLKSWRFDV